MARMPAACACVVLSKGLSPICSSTTSLPWAFSRLATARTSKAVSAVRLPAKRLTVRGSGIGGRVGRSGPGPRRGGRGAAGRRLLFGGDRLGQRPDHAGGDAAGRQL